MTPVTALREVPSKPVPLAVRPAGIPPEMQIERRWVVWKYELRNGSKWTKTPYNASRPEVPAKTSDPSTWRAFKDAWTAYEQEKPQLPQP